MRTTITNQNHNTLYLSATLKLQTLNSKRPISNNQINPNANSIKRCNTESRLATAHAQYHRIVPQLHQKPLKTGNKSKRKVRRTSRLSVQENGGGFSEALKRSGSFGFGGDGIESRVPEISQFRFR